MSHVKCTVSSTDTDDTAKGLADQGLVRKKHLATVTLLDFPLERNQRW
jgi:hypothetical protein